jgi:hypothetical protein
MTKHVRGFALKQTTYITDLAVSVFTLFEPTGCVSLGDYFLFLGGNFPTLGIHFLTTVANDSCIPFIYLHVLDQYMEISEHWLFMYF